MRIIVVGGGAAGMTAAIAAARAGARVIVAERMQRVGKKLLATGNGRCNLTNRDLDLKHFHGADARFVGTVLERFGLDETLEFFEGLGVATRVEEEGKIFPLSGQASSVLDLLRHEMDRLGVEVAHEHALIVSCELHHSLVAQHIHEGAHNVEKHCLFRGLQLGATGKHALFGGLRTGNRATAAIERLRGREIGRFRAEGIASRIVSVSMFAGHLAGLILKQIDRVAGMVPQQMIRPAARIARSVDVFAAEEISLHVHLLDVYFTGGNLVVDQLMRRIKAAHMARHGDHAGFLLGGDDFL